jgi:hypothetical protein
MIGQAVVGSTQKNATAALHLKWRLSEPASLLALAVIRRTTSASPPKPINNLLSALA